MSEQRNYLFKIISLIKIILIIVLISGCTINKHGVFIGSESQEAYRKLLKLEQNTDTMEVGYVK
jgi:hypothetical protein